MLPNIAIVNKIPMIIIPIYKNKFYIYRTFKKAIYLSDLEKTSVDL